MVYYIRKSTWYDKYLLRLIHLNFMAINWLGTKFTALPSIVIASSWQYTGFCMVLFLAGLQQVPKDQLDAADADGAKFYQKIIHIILPNIRPIIMIILMVSMINSFQLFDLIYIITRGGPMRMTEVMGFVMWEETFTSQYWGRGCAYCIILLLITAIPAIIYVREMAKHEEIY